MTCTILQGDWVERLRELPDESVQCCVTSPPYWGLRDYGTAAWVESPTDYCPRCGMLRSQCECWDPVNQPKCDHIPDDTHRQFAAAGTLAGSTSHQENCGSLRGYREVCGKCGAKRIDAQLGLEKTPEEYVGKLVAGFREVRRVLKSDGTLWLNLGDSYSTNSTGNAQSGMKALAEKYRPGSMRENHAYQDRSEMFVKRGHVTGLKPKDLVGIPWLVAFALRADGWWLRQDIIWAKPNPMPESVTDRCTKSHEYLFLLTKSARYFYDAASIADPASQAMLDQVRDGYDGGGTKDFFGAGAQNASDVKSRIIEGARKKARKPAGWATHNGSHGSIHRDGRETEVTYGEIGLTCNKRSVWTVTTQPYSEAHFATFPPDLIKPCIMAGSRPGDVILDPFAGSGTTGQVAIELGRKALLIELNPKYIPLIEHRTHVTPGLALTK